MLQYLIYYLSITMVHMKLLTSWKQEIFFFFSLCMLKFNIKETQLIKNYHSCYVSLLLVEISWMSSSSSCLKNINCMTGLTIIINIIKLYSWRLSLIIYNLFVLIFKCMHSVCALKSLKTRKIQPNFGSFCLNNLEYNFFYEFCSDKNLKNLEHFQKN